MVTRGRFPTRPSPVTGTPEQYQTWPIKILLILKTIAILGPVMVLAILFMVLSLNARGFIDPDHKLLYW